MGILFLLSVAVLAAPGMSVPLRSHEPFRPFPEMLCRDQPNFFRIAASGSCIKYYQCYSGRTYLMLCPDFSWFNEVQQICDDENAPPVGCEVAQPPIIPPPPETEQETPEQPEVPEGSVEQPEEVEGSGEAAEQPEGTEDPEVEPQESEDEPKSESDQDEALPPIEELLPHPESEEASTNEREVEVDTEEPKEPNEESHTDEPDLETEESNVDEVEDLPTEVLEVSGEEGSGDPATTEEVSGFALLPSLLRRLRRREEETPVEVLLVHTSESSEAFSEDHDLDLELDGLILLKTKALVPRDDVVYEIPSIEPVFVLPEHDK